MKLNGILNEFEMSFFKYDDQVVLARVKHASVSQVGLEPDNDNSM